MKKVLFVCTGNTCRSPMAEGIFNSIAEKENLSAHASSAGIFVTEASASRHAIDVSAENGIDISNHIPTQLTVDIANDADVILTMTSSHKQTLLTAGIDSKKVFTAAEYAGEITDISDPYGGSKEDYKKTFDELKGLIKKYGHNFS